MKSKQNRENKWNKADLGEKTIKINIPVDRLMNRDGTNYQYEK